MSALRTVISMLGLVFGLGVLAGCAATPAPERYSGMKPLPPKPRLELVNRLPAGEQPGELAVYSYSTDCERKLGVLSAQTDLRFAQMCQVFSERIVQASEGRATSLQLLPNCEQCAALPQEALAKESEAKYRLVLNVYPVMHPGGSRMTYTSNYYWSKRRIQGEFIVQARLYSLPAAKLVREVEYTRRLAGFSATPALFAELAQQAAEDVVRDFFPG